MVICGTTLQAAGGGNEIAPYDATRGATTIDFLGTGPLYFRVAPGCVHGSHVTWIPRSAAHLVKASYASDGLATAMVLQPAASRARFRLVVTRNGRVIARVTAQPASTGTG